MPKNVKSKESGKLQRGKTTRTYKIVKDSQKVDSYFVTATEGGEVLERTRVLVPSKTNPFFQRLKVAG